MKYILNIKNGYSLRIEENGIKFDRAEEGSMEGWMVDENASPENLEQHPNYFFFTCYGNSISIDVNHINLVIDCDENGIIKKVVENGSEIDIKNWECSNSSEGEIEIVFQSDAEFERNVHVEGSDTLDLVIRGELTVQEERSEVSNEVDSKDEESELQNENSNAEQNDNEEPETEETPTEEPQKEETSKTVPGEQSITPTPGISKSASDTFDSGNKEITGEIIQENPFRQPAVIGCGILTAVVILETLFLVLKRRKNKKNQDRRISNTKNKNTITEMKKIGSIQHIGKRDYQQDRCLITSAQGHLVAVVADGMGGLQDGDKVSQNIVDTIAREVGRVENFQSMNPLYPILARVNEEVISLLGRNNIGKCGSTCVAVCVGRGQFSWVSVGDSRICLYRAGSLLQINHEHIYLKEMLKKAVNQETSFSEAENCEKSGALTSFVGMGKLYEIDGSIETVQVQSGDRILLMSDGVFNILSDQELSEILQRYEDAQEAAEVIKSMVLQKNHPRQDNFTAIIINC